MGNWIAIDWGTTHLRLWSVGPEGTSREIARTTEGMGNLRPEQFEPVLRSALGGVEGPIEAIACGMVGSRQGWVEAPYRTVPCLLPVEGVVKAPVKGPDLAVAIIPGIKQDKPADVMRGEETQIAGFLAQNPNWDGVICLPGTHSKWAQVSAGELVSFRTFMTGEIFALMAGQSVLRHSLGQGWDDAAFGQAVDDALSKPEQMAARLFALRAESLLQGLSGDAARARLSGVLIGAELAAARPYYLGQQVAIIGSETLGKTYAQALAQTATPTQIVRGDQMTLEGLRAAFAAMKVSI